jgi:hypothetical protein
MFQLTSIVEKVGVDYIEHVVGICEVDAVVGRLGHGDVEEMGDEPAPDGGRNVAERD